MTKLNMANMSTLFKKGYLLAGVIMAANIFVVNEVRAMEEDNEFNNIKREEENKNALSLEGVLNFVDWVSYHVLSYENTINLIGGAVFSGANNYLKWCDYNPGSYWQLGCLGWRSGRHIKDIFQIGINLNLGRGILWLIPGTYNFIKSFTVDSDKKKEGYVKPLYFSFLVADRVEDLFIIVFIGVFLIQGFVSVPLAIHISNFSISISLDSIVWMGIGYILELKVKKEIEKKRIEEKIGISGVDDNEKIYDDEN